MRPAPELCVIVLSYRNEAHVVAAIESLLAQDVPVEIVVSHSGGGPTPGLLEPYRGAIRVLESQARRLPGSARNAGIEATQAPWVSFLAADCLALPGWAAGRLARHRRGSVAVAGVMAAPVAPRPALAGYLLQHSSRMPNRDTGPRHYHGLSYARDVLKRFGPFPEDVLQGEDTSLNRRLATAGLAIDWAPEVRTVHRYPVTATALLADHWRRGRIRAGLCRSLRERLRLLAQVGLEAPLAVLRALRSGSPISRMELIACMPLLAAGGIATALGVIRGAREIQPEEWLSRSVGPSAPPGKACSCRHGSPAAGRGPARR